ncbi:MAG: 3-deoxy-8-phosphooctulonate synthase [Candidatus Omnitrophica bacterium]|nr:3-deoxy-8-phosphooctulonate synthase [Candidatus Omnitrophota bacterium]MDD5436100.1 3-deoxy-8-phosphooctulonate synthase [Candidatus Omnitrophota bacterium]
MMKEIQAGNIRMGADNPFVLIAGPCVIESEASAMRHAKSLKAIAGKLGIPFIYKSSFDKANRTSIHSFRGPGLKKGLAILKKIKDTLGVAVLSDVHCKGDVKDAAKVLDVIQIPAFLSRQTDLIVAAAESGKTINIKKGQFLAPWDMKNVIVKIEATGNKKIILTERGVSFGYNNLVSDFRSISIMKEFGYPVVYDATHSVQMPGGLGSKSGGESRFIPYLSRAAVACGADGIFMEVHEDPETALSDGPNMVRLEALEAILLKLKKIEKAVK